MDNIKNMTLWTTGIEVDYGYAGNNKYGWSAKCNWQGGNFIQNGYMEGEIRTRYYEPTIEQAIDEVLIIMNKFGIKPHDGSKFSLYRDEEYEQSEEIKEVMRLEAKRRKWEYYF